MIRKLIATAAMSICPLIAVTSCATNPDNRKEENITQNKTTMKTDGKKLVVFFSHTGENYGVGYIEKGNTHVIADMIADKTGADRFEIVPVNGYPKDSYNDCVEVAKREKESNARPPIKGDVKVEDYDVVFIGYPNWWGEPPMCVFTFIEQHDWKGKTVIPFITHEGSGMGGTDRKIAAACKGADVAIGNGFAIQGKVAQNDRETAAKNVDRWLKSLGLTF